MAALVNIRDFFQKHSKIVRPQTFKLTVVYIIIYCAK